MKKEQTKPNLWVILGTLKDFRRSQGLRHPLQIVILTIILAIMAGAKSERAIARFLQNNRKELIKALHIERKELPSRTSVQRVIQGLDFKVLRDVFYTWARTMIPLNERDFLSVDGKAIRGTVKDAQSGLQAFVSLVSVFVSERKQVLTAEKIQTKKESEIPAVRKLIRLLDLEGVTFTLDALHCQAETLETIVKSKNHYIVGVKENQPKLLETLKKGVANSFRNTRKKK